MSPELSPLPATSGLSSQNLPLPVLYPLSAEPLCKLSHTGEFMSAVCQPCPLLVRQSHHLLPGPFVWVSRASVTSRQCGMNFSKDNVVVRLFCGHESLQLLEPALDDDDLWKRRRDHGLGFQLRMTVIGEVLLSPGTEFITNDRPSGETTYCCLYTFVAVLPTLVANNPRGFPGSAILPFEAKPIGTAMSRSSAPI